MKKLITIMILLIISSVSFASTSEVDIYRDTSLALYGLRDMMGDEIIPPTYDMITFTDDNLYKVRNGNKYGYIDADGKVIVPVSYYDISLFRGEYALAQPIANGKYRIISKDNTLKSDFSCDEYQDTPYASLRPYLYALPLDQDKSIFNTPKLLSKTFVYRYGDTYGVADFEGNILFSIEDHILRYISDTSIAIDNGDLWGIIDFDGNTIIDSKYECINKIYDSYLVKLDSAYMVFDLEGKAVSDSYKDLSPLTRNLYGYCTNEKYLYGIYDMKLQKVITEDIYPKLYGKTNKFNNDKSFVCYSFIRDTFEHFSSVGIFDHNGKGLIPAGEYRFNFISEDLISYMNEDDLLAFYSLLTDKHTQAIYKYANHVDGYTIVTTKDGTKGVLDDNGNYIIDPLYESIDSNGNYLVCFNGVSYALYHKTSSKFVSGYFDDIDFYKSDTDEVYVYVTVDNKQGIMASDGSYLISPLYTYISNFKNGYARTKIKNLGINKYGFVSTDGSLLAETIFASADDFTKQGYAEVELNSGQKNLLNNKGDLIVPDNHTYGNLIYDDMMRITNISSNKKGIINLSGDTLLEAIYDEIGDFKKADYTYVKLDSKYAIIDKELNITSDFKFDKIGSFAGGYAEIIYNGQHGRSDSKGNFELY